ncbi:DUF7535 family protein [Halococcus salifodinae]|uniref:DUF7535 family protein n=1 Tax=Halococcus salifodinae TaxID=36738 RepID=UPI0026A23F2C
MSQSDSDDEQSGLSGKLRAVQPTAGMHSNNQMNIVGILIATGLLVFFLPLLPILVVGWVLLKIFGR